MFKRTDSNDNLHAWFEEHLSEYLDGMLSPKDRARLEAYLAQSEQARQSLESMRWTVGLLRQLPAPPLPRPFTLPVTQRVPAQGTPTWIVWGLRGVAAAATIAFVLLLGVTLLRLPASSPAALGLPAAAPAAPTVMIALQPTFQPTLGVQQESRTNGAQAVTPVMITVEPPEPTADITAVGLALPTLAPAATAVPAAQNPPAPQLPTQEAQATEAPALAGAPSETEQPLSAQLAQPTPTSKIASASAQDSNAPEVNKAGASPTETVLPFSQRNVIVPSMQGTVRASQLKVRAGPGTEYPVIGGLKRGDQVKVVGRAANNVWLAIDFAKNQQTTRGWVGASFVILQAPMDLLAVEFPSEPERPDALPTPLPPTPTPTPTATPTPLPPPTATPTSQDWGSEFGSPTPLPVPDTATPEATATEQAQANETPTGMVVPMTAEPVTPTGLPQRQDDPPPPSVKLP